MKRLFTNSLALGLMLLILASCGTSQQASRQGAESDKQYTSYAVAFYNVENLFDTVDDPNNRGDDEFLPSGPYNWTEAKYERKLDNIARVIGQIAREHTPMGPAFIGISEVENRQVLEDLVAREAIKNMGLKVIHEEGPDRRGIDVAALYNPNIFTLISYETVPFIHLEENLDFVTRDHLHVTGILGGEKIHLIVGHWPSRYGGAASNYLREAAAMTVRGIMAKIYESEPDANIVFMGDLNDDPTNSSVIDVLGAKGKRSEVRYEGLYNPSYSLYQQGIGTLVYQDKWNFFDQMIVSHGLLREPGLRLWKMEVFSPEYLIRQEGRRKGYPHRTFENNSFIEGYSDHFPVLIYLVKER